MKWLTLSFGISLKPIFSLSRIQSVECYITTATGGKYDMKRTKNVTEHAEEIRGILEDIMTRTFHNCKNSNAEMSLQSTRINALAHKCSISVDRLISEYRGER
jgi:ArsR family metal-binding transcriptional regulator